MNTQKKINFLGIPLTVDSEIEQLLMVPNLEPETPQLISFINPHAWYISKNNPEYVKHLNQLSLILIDGIGVIKALKLIKNIKCKRYSFDFSSIAGPVFEACEKHQLTISIIGGQVGTANLATEKLLHLYPGLKITSYWSGFGSDPSNAIQSFSVCAPSIVICGMGAPRQEEFLIQLRDCGWIGTAFTCGGFLDQVIQPGSYYPKWIDKNNLRFLYRLYKEPRRLSKRYLIEYLPFIKSVLLARLNKPKSSMKNNI